MPPTHSLQNRAALVTGGAQGLGEALCRGPGRAGATVAMADFRGENAEAPASKLHDEGAQAVAIPLHAREVAAAHPGVRRLCAPEITVIPMRETSWP